MLDVSTRAGVATTLRHLADRHRLAVLFITHDLGEAVQSCHQILVLHRRAAQAGRPDEVVANSNPGDRADLVAAARRHLRPPSSDRDTERQ
ncbi:hypothetical protein [Plantactinospora sp. KLBMP9567]|uniref:hypothetical protein n=1 Tax=Plantactinospora sp. KLBMP9567 TaxID=3085900 RepID=UPI0029828AA6|nr:hypothetical protein [Plantactinospora sp. KLBMP9567]MDW5330640.1 hypothetical protein [Plantactinospora sp. KLBMP9567]